MNELKELERGRVFKMKNGTKILKFFVLAGVFDKPARSSILEIKTSGRYSCLKCLQKGVSIRTEKGERLIDLLYQA